MTQQTTKPKEYEITIYTNEATGHKTATVFASPNSLPLVVDLKLVEHSAFEAMRAERDELLLNIEQSEPQFKQLIKERDELLVDREKLFRVVKIREKQCDELRRDIEKWKNLVEKVNYDRDNVCQEKGELSSRLDAQRLISEAVSEKLKLAVGAVKIADNYLNAGKAWTYAEYELVARQISEALSQIGGEGG